MSKTICWLAASVLVLVSGAVSLSQSHASYRLVNPIDFRGPKGGALVCVTVIQTTQCDQTVSTPKGTEACPAGNDYMYGSNPGNTSEIHQANCATPCNYNCGTWINYYFDCAGKKKTPQ